jgi:uncharacterized protein YukE
MTQFHLNFGTVGIGVEDLKAFTLRIHMITEQLEAAVEPALASWDGAAKAQYQIEKGVWDAAILRMADKLGISSNVLDQISENTKRTEVNNEARFTGVGNPKGS